MHQRAARAQQDFRSHQHRDWQYNWHRSALSDEVSEPCVDISQIRGLNVDDLLPNYRERRAQWATPTGARVDDKGLCDAKSIWEPNTRVCVDSIQLHGSSSAVVDRLVFIFPEIPSGTSCICTLTIYAGDIKMRV
jgi:hypothetical protein